MLLRFGKSVKSKRLSCPDVFVNGRTQSGSLCPDYEEISLNSTKALLPFQPISGASSNS
jgi:hypothetical protein